MKNIRILKTVKLDLNAAIVGQCIDADTGRILVLTENFEVFEAQEHKPSPVKHDLDHTALNLGRIQPDDVILVEFIVEYGSILLALKDGRIIRIGVSSFSPPSSLIYTHPRGLSSIKLSPDQELVALADESNDISILSSGWILIHSSNALTQDDSVHKPVGVGWGSKETQFFGLDGRPSKEKQDKNQVIVGEEEINKSQLIEQSATFKRYRSRHEKATVIDWRGDGQFLATLTFIPDCGKHYLKVWNRNLELQYMSEQLVTMERGLLAWIPNGQYACCAQRRDVRVNEIAMFEKNGMVHQRVSLPTLLPHLYIEELSWSPDSKILAIIVVQYTISENFEVARSHMIMLYTMQNFHYYLKSTSKLPQESDNYLLRWNPIDHSILYVASSKGQCVEYCCSFTVDYCLEDATVVVVDSNKLLVTPFDICNIPPPMSAIKCTLPALITQVLVDSGPIKDIHILTTDGKLWSTAVEDETNTDVTVEALIDNKAIASFKAKLSSWKSVNMHAAHTYQNLTILTRGKLLATKQRGSGCDIFMLAISDLKIEPVLVKEIPSNQVIAIVTDACSEDSFIVSLICDDSTCARLDVSKTEIVHSFVLKKSTERLQIKEIQSVPSYGAIFTLATDSTLRVNEHIIVSNCCSSFRISNNFLIYTTLENLINFVPLDRIGAGNKQSDLGSWTQPIETDGTLTLVSESDSKVILQMPRGNLEILHPRIMVLLRITNYLDACDYISAMQLARRYRVDLNFLCDYLLRCNEVDFYGTKLNRLALEIAQQDPNLLNLMISELSSEDTTQDRYASAMNFLPMRTRELESKQVLTLNEKVNKICSSIKLPETNHYLQPRLLCLLKQEPSKVGQALGLIHGLANVDEKEAALKFILYFVHVDQLFLDAISTYSTDLALMVATVSSKDPKEYLALLDGFKAIENKNLRQYRMDLHVKNYEKAFSNLLAYLNDSPDKDVTKSQLIELMVSKRIYKHAIQACFDQFVDFLQLSECKLDPFFEELGIEIWTRYGDYLLEKRYYLEAGLAYSKSIRSKNDIEKKLDNVLKCFLLADDWKRCLAVIERYGMPSPKREETLKKISNNLLQQSSITSALFIMQFKKDNELARQIVSSEPHLAEALSDENGICEIKRLIFDSIQDQVDKSIHQLETDIDNAKKYFVRLKELLLTPQKNIVYNTDNCFASDSLSTVDGSEATSVISGSKRNVKTARSGAPSIATRTSSKSSKSQAAKKKKIHLKEGSRNEDMALVIELQSLIGKQKVRNQFYRDLLAAQIEYNPSSSPNLQVAVINDLLREEFGLARDITNTLWPKLDHEDNVFSLYKRFGSRFLTEESIDNEDIKLLLRPDVPSSIILLEF